MFTTIVAYAALTVTSIIFIVLSWDLIRPESETEQFLKSIYPDRYQYKFAWNRLAVLAAIWFVSGWYLFG